MQIFYPAALWNPSCSSAFPTILQSLSFCELRMCRQWWWWVRWHWAWAWFWVCNHRRRSERGRRWGYSRDGRGRATPAVTRAKTLSSLVPPSCAKMPPVSTLLAAENLPRWAFPAWPPTKSSKSVVQPLFRRLGWSLRVGGRVGGGVWGSSWI